MLDRAKHDLDVYQTGHYIFQAGHRRGLESDFAFLGCLLRPRLAPPRPVTAEAARAGTRTVRVLRSENVTYTGHCMPQAGHNSGSEGWDADSEGGADAVAVSQQGSLGALSEAGAGAGAATGAPPAPHLRASSVADAPPPDIGVCRCPPACLPLDGCQVMGCLVLENYYVQLDTRLNAAGVQRTHTQTGQLKASAAR